MKLYFSTILLFVVSFCFGQDTTSRIRFIVSPEGSIIKLDGKKVNNATVIYTTAGEHTVQVWAPRMKYYEEKITASKDSVFTYRKYLEKSAEYVSFEKVRDSIHKIRSIRILEKSCLVFWNVGLATAIGALAPHDARAHYKNAERFSDLYYKSVSNVPYYKDLYEQERVLYNDAVKKRNRYLAITLPIVSASVAVSIFAWIKIKKAPKRAKYTETPLLSKMDVKVHMNFFDPNASYVGFTYKF